MKGLEVIGGTKLLISSYSYKFSLGFKEFFVSDRMKISDFLLRAKHHGLDGVQIVDNVAPETFDDGQIQEIIDIARGQNLELQWGFSGWESHKVERLLHLCSITNSRLLRGVYGETFFKEESNRSKRLKRALDSILKVIPKLEQENVILAIENHFDLPARELKVLMEKIDHPLVRICMDTTNALGELIRPSEIVDLLGQYSVTMHLKDFKISKIIGGYQILGAPIGEGDQDCERILKQALKINPDMEVCIELGMAWPEDGGRIRALEEEWVETSFRNTKAYLKNILSYMAGVFPSPNDE